MSNKNEFKGSGLDPNENEKFLNQVRSTQASGVDTSSFHGDSEHTKPIRKVSKNIEEIRDGNKHSSRSMFWLTVAILIITAASLVFVILTYFKSQI